MDKQNTAELLQNMKQDVEVFLQVEAFESYPPLLMASTNQIMAMQGKRIRPLLLLLTCYAFADEYHVAIPAAAAIEVFHNFSLVHDDIIDKAALRRGHETVHKKFGQTKAILTGDAMLIRGYQLLAMGPANTYTGLARVFSKAALEVIEGEQADVNFEEQREISMNSYLDMIRKKTSVLLAAAAQMGSIVGRADEHDQEKIHDFGINIGLSFQMKDDYLDVFGDHTFGKTIGGDILLNKKTFLLVSALELAWPELKQEIFSIFDLPDDERKIEVMISIYDKLNIREKTKEKISEYYNNALENIMSTSLPADKKQMIVDFAELVNNRTF
jgi:geranylgeranyl diphosphate synthase, type II